MTEEQAKRIAKAVLDETDRRVGFYTVNDETYRALLAATTLEVLRIVNEWEGPA